MKNTFGISKGMHKADFHVEAMPTCPDRSQETTKFSARIQKQIKRISSLDLFAITTLYLNND